MNDASTTARAVEQPTSSSAAVSDDNANAIAPVTEDGKTLGQRRLQIVMQRKNEILAHLLENMDSIIYMELAVLYYMDNSLFRLLVRGVNQLMFLTPKPAFLPAAPQKRPYIGAIFAPNIICILLHILTARSFAGEEMRGYLHGGVILDLIGQKGPTSKIHLVILDVLVWVLQCIMLTVILEKERIGKAVAKLKEGVRIEAVTMETETTAQSRTIQDVDAEEQGILRHGMTESGDVELDELDRSNSNASAGLNEEHEHLLAGSRSVNMGVGDNDAESHPLDVFYSRKIKIATFHILPSLRSQWQDYGNTSGSALQTVGFSAEFARVAASRRLGAAGQRLQQQVGSLGT